MLDTYQHHLRTINYIFETAPRNSYFFLKSLIKYIPSNIQIVSFRSCLILYKIGKKSQKCRIF